MSFRRGFVVGTVSLVVFACTSGTGSGSNGAADSTSFLSQFCDAFAPCCGKVGKPTDGAQCRTVYSAFTAGSDYDATKGTACLNDLHAQQAKDTFCDDPTASSAACKGVFRPKSTGVKQPGDACTSDTDCASSSEGEVRCQSTYSSTGAVTKTCQLQLDGKEGDAPCVGTRDGTSTSYPSTSSSDGGAPPPPPARGYLCDVATGTFCNGKTSTCTKIEDVGGPCTSGDAACVKSAYCEFSTQKCTARIPLDGDCSKVSQGCVEKSACDTTTKKCVALAEGGTACTASSTCLSRTCVNGKCGSSGSSSTSTAFLCGN